MPEENKKEEGKFIFNAPVGNVANTNQGIQNTTQNYTSEQKQSLAEAAKEIQQLLDELNKSYPSDSKLGQMQMATEVVSQIENNPAIKTKVLSALKAGSIAAFEQFLNHPAASFVLTALEDWQKKV